MLERAKEHTAQVIADYTQLNLAIHSIHIQLGRRPPNLDFFSYFFFHFEFFMESHKYFCCCSSLLYNEIWNLTTSSSRSDGDEELWRMMIKNFRVYFYFFYVLET